MNFYVTERESGRSKAWASRRLSAVPRRSDRARRNLIFGSVRDGSRKQKDRPKAVSDFATSGSLGETKRRSGLLPAISHEADAAEAKDHHGPIGWSPSELFLKF
jgi:hypothetical protein